uniref:L-fucose mutarotase n=1 Tax=Camelus bactrianus TaxID=9837 RepID=A0A9W3HG73_CAMBA|nr:fucose mutarotase isoform X9 [Camelus bactrianus]
MVVLKAVPALLSPELLYALARMGHGDEIVLADVNFPTSSICRCGPEEIRADGLGIPQLLEAMLKLLPLDTYVEKPPVWRRAQWRLLGPQRADPSLPTMSPQGASVGCVRVVCVEDASAAGQDSTVLQPRTGAWCGVVSSSF